MGHIGEYDNSLRGELIQPGEYQVKVVSPKGKVIHKETISVKADQTTTVRLPG